MLHLLQSRPAITKTNTHVVPTLGAMQLEGNSRDLGILVKEFYERQQASLPLEP